ncbi:MAG: 4-phosphoerythronate dehydrogenase [Bacteroidales bacterium]|nr:4-phosphoerythronate dehydrogenase [Bacteroidales bacterium]
MKIIVESHIPYVGNSLDDLGEVVRLTPDEITREAVADADALIVRTRTRCGAPLLDGSAVKFVATATIGTDHIDRGWCASRGIEVHSCPGCNAPAVAQYVWSSVLRLRDCVEGAVIGVVGLGNVGSIVARWARSLGAKVLACDPPRERATGGWDPENPAAAGSEPFVTLDHIARHADIITFHTPFTREGGDRTFHIAGAEFFDSLVKRPIVINAARGGVVDTPALEKAICDRRVSAAVIDCWEGEPAISRELLELAHIATPHIAGYSIEGKQRATASCVGALRRFAGAKVEQPAPIVPPPYNLAMPFGERIVASYDPLADTAALRRDPSAFEALRNHYPLRHEVAL